VAVADISHILHRSITIRLLYALHFRVKCACVLCKFFLSAEQQRQWFCAAWNITA